MCHESRRRASISPAACRSSANIIWPCHFAFCAISSAGVAAASSLRAGADMPKLSAIVIAKNEAKNIGECLDSLRFCDERIVVDDNSDDGTAQLAEKKGARLATHEWKGFGPQKNFA